MMLLELIDQTGSINQAAKQMRMAYKSAWSKIRSTEKHLQAKVVITDRGTGTRLTATGRQLLERYKLLKASCIEADDLQFASLFNATETAPWATASHKDAVCTPRRNSGKGTIPSPPIVSFVGHSESGKTTFLEKLIPALVSRKVRVGTIKHDVHGFQMDKPGKDSWRHKQAGATATIISSPQQVGMVKDVSYDHPPDILIPILHGCDLVLTEGYKSAAYPKIEVFRPEATNDPLPLCLDDPMLLAVVTDATATFGVPVFSTQDASGVADLIINRFDL